MYIEMGTLLPHRSSILKPQRWGGPNEADEVVHRAHFVIRDLEKEGRNGLPDSCKVGVRRLSQDRLELIEGMGKFRHDLFGRHSGSKMACPSS